MLFFKKNKNTDNLFVDRWQDNEKLINSLSYQEQKDFFLKLDKYYHFKKISHALDTSFLCCSVKEFFDTYSKFNIKDEVVLDLEEYLKFNPYIDNKFIIGGSHGDPVICYGDREGIWEDMGGEKEDFFDSPSYPNIYAFILHSIGLSYQVYLKDLI